MALILTVSIFFQYVNNFMFGNFDYDGFNVKYFSFSSFNFKGVSFDGLNFGGSKFNCFNFLLAQTLNVSICDWLKLSLIGWRHLP